MPYTTVHWTADPIEADMLGDLLRQNDIAARVLGTRHGAAIGVPQAILTLHIEVPAEQAGDALELIDAFARGQAEAEEAAGIEAMSGAGPDGDGGDADREDSVDEAPPVPGQELLRHLLAAGAVLAIFGGSHLYARRPWTAGAIAACQLGALAVMFGGGSHEAASAAATFGVLLAADLIGGQLAVGAWNRGARATVAKQVVAGALLVGAAIGCGVLADMRRRRIETHDDGATGRVVRMLPVRA